MRHLAIIPDGNRRWARQNKLQTMLGHKKGVNSFKHAIQACLENKIQYLSLYALSIENLNRSNDEKEYLFSLIPEECKQTLPDLIDKKVRVKFIGNRSLFPERILSDITEIEEQTKNFDTLLVNFLFCYGGQQEIISGIKNIISDVINGNLDMANIT